MNECVFIYRTYHICIPHISHIVSWRFTILSSEIERQLINHHHQRRRRLHHHRRRHHHHHRHQHHHHRLQHHHHHHRKYFRAVIGHQNEV